MDEKEVVRLVETHVLLDMKEAEQALISEQEIDIEILGDTPDAKLGHITAAIWIVEKMRNEGCDISVAMRAYQEIIR